MMIVRNETTDDLHKLERVAIVTDLIQRRKDLGLTQADVGRRLGVRQAAIGRIESEALGPRDISICVLQRYARAVGMRLRITLEEDSPDV